tara:strand:+ start:829 stop:1737 length:909 start_codon:yes stop_codon:yes gene_type:complete
MSSDDDARLVCSAEKNRRVFVRRTLIAAVILLCVACAYSFFLVIRFHVHVAAFQKQNADMMVVYQDQQGKTVFGSYGAIPGPFFIPPPFLRYHHSVSWMDLRHQPDSNPAEMDELFRLFRYFPKLEELQLAGFLIDQERAAAIARLPGLHTLSLKGCQIQKSCLAALLQKEGLTHVGLADAEFEETELAALSQGAPNETLLALSLSHCKVTDQSATVLAQCRNLEFLELDGTQITDRSLKLLSRLPQLKVLILDHTAVTDAGVAALSSSPHLVELSLSNTGASDAVLETLRQKLPALQVSDD